MLVKITNWLGYFCLIAIVYALLNQRWLMLAIVGAVFLVLGIIRTIYETYRGHTPGYWHKGEPRPPWKW